MVMKMKLMALLVVAVVQFAPATAWAIGDTWYSQFSGNWHDTNMFTPNENGSGLAGTPDLADIVYIKYGTTVTIAGVTAEANIIVVMSNTASAGTLQVGAGGVLKIKTSVTVDDSSTVPGTFRFNNATGTATLVADDNNNSNAVVVTLDGNFSDSGAGGVALTQLDGDASDNDGFYLTSGSTLSLGSSAVVSAPFENDGEISGTPQFTHALLNGGTIYAGTFDAAVENNGTIRGTTFVGSAEFNAAIVNNGSIEADGDNVTFNASVENYGTIWAYGGDIDFQAAPDADSTGLFKVDGSGNVMLFDFSGACNITGGADFEVGAGGHLTFNENTTTTGGIKIAGSASFPGKVTAAPTITFEATGDF